MVKLSIIIPSFNEPYLGKTVRDLLNKAKGDIEIFVNIDGDMPKKLVKDKRVTYTHHQEPIGMRGGTNLALKKTKSKFIMKTDAHCVFAKGFDEVLKRDCKENWLMIPRRYSLNQVEWDRSLKSPVKDYHYYTYPNKKTGFGMPCPTWPQMTRKKMNDPKYDIDDTMAFQGSCWFAHRSFFMKKVGFLDDSPDKYTPYSGEQLETGLKYWLTDGEVKVNKKTWYAHLLKTSNYYKAWKLSRKVKTSRLTWKGHRWAAKHWLNNEEPGMKHKFQWLVEKFWPVPNWPENRKLWQINGQVSDTYNTSPQKKIQKPDLNTEETPLCKLAYKYGTDKCSKYKHPYTPYYHKLFNRSRKNVKKLLELGIGYPGCMRHVKNYRHGASLKMWRDFFPNAQIYGADIRPDTMFKEDRIKTFLCDERKKDDLVKLVKSVGPDVDIFIDDGIHEEDDQIFVCLTLMPLFRSGVIYIIEDVEDYKKVMDALVEYDCEVVHLPKSRISRTHRDLVIVKHRIEETPLCKLAYKYGTDKCPKIKHNFTPYYYSLFKNIRKSVKLVFEMGIGFYNNMQKIDKIYDPNLKRWYHKGASLKMWRDFFPNAQTIGADIRPITQFEEKRIKTYICDESDTRNIRKLIKKFGERIDIFIDDASHNVNMQVLLAKTALPLLRKDVIYIIEDVMYPKYICEQLNKYDCEVIKCSKRWRDDHLVVVKKS